MAKNGEKQVANDVLPDNTVAMTCVQYMRRKLLPQIAPKDVAEKLEIGGEALHIYQKLFQRCGPGR